MRDQVCLVTGATSGIGKETAQALVALGATVVVVGRNPERTEALVASLRAGIGDAGGRVESILGDLATLAEVRAVAAAFKARYDRLDRLVNNAGAIFTTRQETSDGFERTFALNHLAYYLLTVELLPLLQHTPEARVISTASAGHHFGKLDFDDLQFQRRAWLGGWAPYCQSKLCNVLFARALGRRLQATGGVAHSVHPGVVATGFLATGNGALARASMTMARPFMRTPAQGAATLIWATTAPEPGTFTGAYLANSKVAKASKRGQNDADAERLWQVSAELCGVRAD